MTALPMERGDRSPVPPPQRRPRTIAVGAAILDPARSSGLDRYTDEVLRALLTRHPSLVAYTSAEPLLRQHPGQARRVRAAVSGNDFRGNLLRLLWHQLALPAALRRDAAAVFYSTVAEGMLRPPCAQVITIHDLIPLLYPEHSPRQKHYFRHVLPRLVRASRAVIVDSEATRADVARLLPVDETPLHVVYPGYGAGTFRPRPEPEVERFRTERGLGDFVLAVGETRPNKNLPRLIRAFARLPRRDLTLLVVGRIFDAELLNLPLVHGIADRVHFLGRVTDDELAALYAAAGVFVFPSLYEGFGIPPLEAMACGCPVVVSRAASIPEVCGDAAVYVDPADTGCIARGIAQVLGDSELRAGLRHRGLERVKQFGYGRAADRILEILLEVSDARQRGSTMRRGRELR
jgi:glycosyltransferase involved in cell wall biosynthesis